MIKRSIVNNIPVYTAECAHIIFYKDGERLAYVIATPIFIGNKIEQPAEVNRIVNRGHSIEEVYQIEDADFKILKVIYENTRINGSV